MDKEMERVLKSGLMVLNILVVGSMIKQMDMEHCIMLMEISTKVSGSMIRLMAKVFILMQMEPTIMENGKMTNNMDLELKSGQMVQFMRVTTLKERKMVLVSLRLLMDQYMKAISQ